ncbi:hypothetical protein QYM36_009766 [Artemia franciscana]|uniref:methionine adenosyltransferase n=1 Tax=Artemia franciscana TaxID=6661 RepID=A0AA88HXG9_ARTSF|nr:hypothetical protein QYM36_009766 [Artemia franciscana]
MKKQVYTNLFPDVEVQKPSINKFNVGYLVRINKSKGAFDKGYLPNYTTKVFQIAQVKHSTAIMYELSDKTAECEYYFDQGACIPIRVRTVVISVQHSEKNSLEQLQSDIMEHVVKTVIPGEYLDSRTVFHINPCGAFIIGGPMGDSGLTGRKIIVDTYGGWGAHGGGAFSGKDFTKVDRSTAYAAIWVAKSLVKSGICRRCLVQVSYAIDVAEPLSITIFDHGTSDKTQKELITIVKKNFDLRPDFFSWEQVKPLIL